jgi:hypothetical protein
MVCNAIRNTIAIMPEPRKTKTNWYKRFNNAKAPHVVTLHTDFAGIKSGSALLISSPAQIATYISAIPHGEMRTIARLRSDLAKKSKADAMCPVTTAIYLRVVAEVALSDMQAGKTADEVPPFWRIIEPNSKIAGKLSCGPEGVEHLAALERAGVAS